MEKFDIAELLKTARRFERLSRSYETTACDLKRTWELRARLTRQEEKWLEFLLNYSRSLSFMARHAEAIACDEEFP